MLHNCIISLTENMHQIDQYFHRAKNGELFNFVIDVQPFTEQVDVNLNQLNNYNDEILSLPLMNEKKLSLLILYIRELSVDCFFDKTSKKIFIDKFKAVNHDLQYIKRVLEKE